MRPAQSLSPEDKQDKVFRVFEKIAKGYDSANVRISLGMQDSWKKMLIRELSRADACGAGTEGDPAEGGEDLPEGRGAVYAGGRDVH